VERRHREGELLLPAQRQGTYRRIGLRAEIEAMQQLDGAAQRLHPPKTVDSGKKPDIFPHREVVVEREALAHVADAAFNPLSFAHHVVTGDRTASRRGIAQSAQHPHGSGLSGTVGAEESEDFAPRHIERNAVYGGKVAEPLAQFPDGYDRFTHGASVL